MCVARLKQEVQAGGSCGGSEEEKRRMGISSKKRKREGWRRGEQEGEWGRRAKASSRRGGAWAASMAGEGESERE